MTASTTAVRPFDFAPLLAAGLPAPAIKWNGFPKYNFTGGHNDAAQVPVEELIAAATAVLKREGRTLATYGLANGPLGYRRLREFLAEKLKRDAGISCTADEILITSGSLQGIELVNGLLLSRGDTVLVEQVTYFGSLSRLARLGVNAIGVPLDHEGLRLDALSAALDDLKGRGIRPKYIYTIPTVKNPTGAIMGQERRLGLLRLAETHNVPIFEDDCYADLIWDGKRPPAIYALSKSRTSSTSAHFPNRSRRRCGSGMWWRTGRCCRACCHSRPTRAPAPLSRWCSPNIARRILPPMCRN